MKSEKYEEVAPSTSLVESVRNFGYDLNTAISDLIDNSISANARKIEITLLFEESEPCVLIKDDGLGMTDEVLKNSIVLGSQDPTELRLKGDLGRFGLGLKTASFSMCRQLNVFSKAQSHSIAFRSWDLDVVRKYNKWLVSKEFPDWYESLEDCFKLSEAGTLIVWKKCDRLKQLFTDLKKMNELGADLQSHIGTYFSRFLNGPQKISITVNDNEVIPWDPICEGSRSMGMQSIGNIQIHPYVLPAKDAFDDIAKFEKTAGIKGWNAQQGFYLFRNKRLIVNGGWLNLKRMKLDEHTKLARIIIDFDSSDDEGWHVDVSKSKASVPMGTLRDHVDAIARHTRKEAEKIYRHRAKTNTREITAPDGFIWKTHKASDGKIAYKINRKHAVVRLLFEKHTGPRRDIEKLLILLEKLLPKESIQINANKDNLDALEVVYDEILELAEQSVELQIAVGKSKKSAVNDLLTFEPFSSFKVEFLEHFNVD